MTASIVSYPSERSPIPERLWYSWKVIRAGYNETAMRHEYDEIRHAAMNSPFPKFRIYAQCMLKRIDAKIIKLMERTNV